MYLSKAPISNPKGKYNCHMHDFKSSRPARCRSCRGHHARPDGRHVVALGRKDADQKLGEVDVTMPVVIEGLEHAESDLVRHADVHHGKQLLELVEAQLVVPVPVQAAKHADKIPRRKPRLSNTTAQLLHQQEPVSILPNIAERVAYDADRDRHVQTRYDDQQQGDGPSGQSRRRYVAIAHCGDGDHSEPDRVLHGWDDVAGLAQKDRGCME
mmetsp:Transcript_72240/g.209217  ORF Transcript_72240/g.209217 Transcript_72240/m.209217 type:complete len:212 (-) Transcript_72240:1264-1899(-)